MYKEFEKEYLNGTGALLCKEVSCEENMCKFEFTNSESNSERVYTVNLDLNMLKVDCSCKKFSWMGMLCSHALAALHRKNVDKLPREYIYSRWTKDVKKHFYGMNEDELTKKNDKEIRVMYSNRAMRFAYNLVTQSESCKEARDILLSVFEDGAKLLDEFFKKKNVGSTSELKDNMAKNDNFEQHNGMLILDPLRAKPKGTRNCRIKGHFEKRKPKKSCTSTRKKSKRQGVSTSPEGHFHSPSVQVPTPSQFPNSSCVDATGNCQLQVQISSRQSPSPQFPWSTPLVGVSSSSKSLDSSITQPHDFTWTTNIPHSFTSMMQVYNQMNNSNQDQQ